MGWGGACQRSCARAWDVDARGYVNVLVNWGGMGHVNVHVHLRGTLILWAILLY